MLAAPLTGVGGDDQNVGDKPASQRSWDQILSRWHNVRRRGNRNRIAGGNAVNVCGIDLLTVRVVSHSDAGRPPVDAPMQAKIVPGLSVTANGLPAGAPTAVVPSAHRHRVSGTKVLRWA